MAQSGYISWNNHRCCIRIHLGFHGVYLDGYVNDELIAISKYTEALHIES